MDGLRLDKTNLGQCVFIQILPLKLPPSLCEPPATPTLPQSSKIEIEIENSVVGSWSSRHVSRQSILAPDKCQRERHDDHITDSIQPDLPNRAKGGIF